MWQHEPLLEAAVASCALRVGEAAALGTWGRGSWGLIKLEALYSAGEFPVPCSVAAIWIYAFPL